MKTFTIFLAVAMVCFTVPALADVRAFYDMDEDPNSPQMNDSSGYGNFLWVGDSTAVPFPNSCWSSPAGVFTPWDGAAWHAIAGRDIGTEDPGNTSLLMGMTNYLRIEFDIMMDYAGGQQCIVMHNSSADYGVFTNDNGDTTWSLEYSSWDAVDNNAWWRWHDTTHLNYDQWYHCKVTLGAGSDADHRTLSFYVDDMENPTSTHDIGHNGGGGSGSVLEIGGALISGPTNFGKYLMGSLDNVQIDISAPIPDYPGQVNFYQEFTPDTATLLLYHFNEGSGTVVQDAGDSWTDKWNIQYRGFDGYFAFGLDPAKTWAVGKFGTCLSTYYNGIDTNQGGILVDQSDTAFPFETGLGVGSVYNMTIEFWFNPQQADKSAKQIVAKGGGADFAVYWGASDTYIYSIAFGYYTTHLPSSWNTVIDTAHPLPMNQWTHIAITVDRTTYETQDHITFYHNGVQTYQTLAPACTGGDHDNLYIMSNYTGAPASFVHAKIDELRISKCIRPYAGDQPVPESNWVTPYTGADSNTILLFHLDETTGTVAYDAAPEAGLNHGNTMGNTFDAMSSADITWSPFTRSYTLNGTSSEQIRTANGPELDLLNQLTVEAWIKLDLYPDEDFWIIAKKVWNYDLFISPSGQLMGQGHHSGGTYGVSYSQSGAIPLNKWTHVAMVRDPQSEKVWTQLYINGKEVEYAVRNYWLPRLTSAYTPLMVAGQHLYSSSMEGKIDELRVSNIARTFNPIALRIAGIARDLVDNIKLTIEAADDGSIYFLKAGEDLLDKSSWVTLWDFEGAIPNVEYVDTGVLSSYDQMFYQAEVFVPTPQGFPAIAEKTITVDADLSEWSGSDSVATRDNFYPSYDNRNLPYVQHDIYAAYNSSDNALYIAFMVEELSSSDVLELMFIDPADSTQRQIAFDKFGTVNFYEGDSVSIRAMQDTGGDTYTLPDFQADGGAISTAKSGGTWRGEVKVPYAFIGATYTFGPGDQRVVFFNRSAQADASLGTTNPDKHFWAWYNNFGEDPETVPMSYHDPNVGVSR